MIRSWSFENVVWGLFNKFAALEQMTRPVLRDGADELTEREAEEEVSEPREQDAAKIEWFTALYPDNYFTPAISVPAAASPRPAAACGEAVSATPTAPASPHSPDLASWLVPAVLTVLAEHAPAWHENDVYCRHLIGDPLEYVGDVYGWREHVTPLIAAHIAQALPDFPNWKDIQ